MDRQGYVSNGYEMRMSLKIACLKNPVACFLKWQRWYGFQFSWQTAIGANYSELLQVCARYTKELRSCTQSWWQGIRLYWEIILSAPFVPNQFFVVQFPSFKSPFYPSSKVFLSATRARLLLLCKQGPIKSIIRPWTIEDPLSIQSLLSKVMLGIYGFYFCPLDPWHLNMDNPKCEILKELLSFPKKPMFLWSIGLIFWMCHLKSCHLPSICVGTLWGCLTMPATAPLGLRWSANARKIVWNDLDLEINTHPIPITHGLTTENSWII